MHTNLLLLHGEKKAGEDGDKKKAPNRSGKVEKTRDGFGNGGNSGGTGADANADAVGACAKVVASPTELGARLD